MYGSWTENVGIVENFFRINLRHLKRFNDV